MIRRPTFGLDPRDEDVLRVNIDGRWSAGDVARLFSEFEALNEMASFGEVRIDGQSDLRLWGFHRRYRQSWGSYWADLEYELEEEIEESRLRHFLRGAAPRRPLGVKEIKFASPRFSDLVGLAGVVREIRTFVMDIADRFIAAPDRALAREDKHQSIMTKKIANAERLLKLSNKAGLDSDMQRDLIRRALETDRYIEDKIIDGEITSFE